MSGYIKSLLLQITQTIKKDAIKFINKWHLNLYTKTSDFKVL
jgi:hypothetical protein